MNIQKKTASGIYLVPIETELFENRTIFLEGEITFEKAQMFVKQIMQLTLEDPEETIKVIIDSPGGIIDAGFVIYDMIQTSFAPIMLYCTGRAYSMAAIILMCGKCGRFILPNAKVMLHQPLIHECPGGTASSVKSLSDSLMQERDKLNRIIAKHTGMTLKQVNKATSFDHYYDAEEAVEANLCDVIVDVVQML